MLDQRDIASSCMSLSQLQTGISRSSNSNSTGIITTAQLTQAPTLTLSRTASPHLTMPPSGKDLAVSSSDHDSEIDFHQVPSSFLHWNNPAHSLIRNSASHPGAAKDAGSQHGHGTYSDRTEVTASSSRPGSGSVVRARSPAAAISYQDRSHSVPAADIATSIGGGLSRASTPLLYLPQRGHTPSTSQSSSSFLLSSGDHSYTLFDNQFQISTTELHLQSDMRRNPLSSTYVRYRIESLVNGVRSALAIGVKGEWQDSQTGEWKIPCHLKAYVPLLIWVGISIAFGVIVGVWHTEVFTGLDALSVYLKSQGFLGDFILYLCIFMTTFPPLPLYSTFIILSGYSFGLWEGFIISYAAALSGAVVVYLCSKIWLKDGMEGLLNKSQGLKKVVRAIERRPKLLYLIRLSPYPYNVMNVLLASSSTLSFSCYFWCTALSLPKLLVHCSVGTTIRSFAESAQDRSKEGFDEMVDYDDDTLAREKSGERMKAIAGIVGILLCVGVFIYLLIVARRAVDELADESDTLPTDGRHRSSSMLEGHLGHQGIPEGRTSMAEYRPLSNENRKSMHANVVAHRQMFERQHTGFDRTPFVLGDILLEEHKSRRGNGSVDIPPSYDGRWSTNCDSKEGAAKDTDRKMKGSWGKGSEIVDRLERVASERMHGST